MNKRVNLIFQLVMAVLLIGFGILIELKSEIEEHGIFLLSLVIPGVILGIDLLVRKLLKQKHLISALVLFCLLAIFDGVVLFIFHLLSIGIKGYIVFVVIDIITCLICIMLNAIHENAK